MKCWPKKQQCFKGLPRQIFKEGNPIEGTVRGASLKNGITRWQLIRISDLEDTSPLIQKAYLILKRGWRVLDNTSLLGNCRTKPFEWEVKCLPYRSSRETRNLSLIPYFKCTSELMYLCAVCCTILKIINQAKVTHCELCVLVFFPLALPHVALKGWKSNIGSLQKWWVCFWRVTASTQPLTCRSPLHPAALSPLIVSITTVRKRFNPLLVSFGN